MKRFLNRKIVWLFLIISIIYPLLNPIGFPITVKSHTQKAYDSLDALPPGGIVGFAMETQAGQWPETGPMSIALLQHLFRLPVKIMIFTTNIEGPLLSEKALASIDKGDKEYGMHYVILPYIAGGETGVAAIAKGIHTVYTEDYYGTQLEELKLMTEIDTAKDIDLVVEVTSGGPGYVEYIRQWNEPYGVPLVVGAIGVMGSGTFPWLESGQIVGALIGIRGAAEYEALIDKRGEGTSAMDAISATHLLVIVAIIVGNIKDIILKSLKRGKETTK